MLCIKKLFAIYIFLLVLFMVIKPHWGWSYLVERVYGIYELRKAGYWNLNLQPFVFSEMGSVTRLNIAVFVPLGIFLNMLDYRFLKAFIVSAFIIFCIELSQFVFCLGVADVDDFLLNILGTIIGYAFCFFLRFIYKLKCRFK